MQIRAQTRSACAPCKSANLAGFGGFRGLAGFSGSIAFTVNGRHLATCRTHIGGQLSAMVNGVIEGKGEKHYGRKLKHSAKIQQDRKSTRLNSSHSSISY